MPNNADMVENPAHYAFAKIHDYAIAEKLGLSPMVFNALKYIQRHQRKGKPIQDLKKAAR